MMLGKVQKMYPCSTAFKIEKPKEKGQIKVGFVCYSQNPDGRLTVTPSLAIIGPPLDADLHLVWDEGGFGQGQRGLVLCLFHLSTLRSRPPPFPDA